MVPRLGRGFADRFHGAAHTGEGITDGNQLAALSAAWLYSPMLLRQRPLFALALDHASNYFLRKTGLFKFDQRLRVELVSAWSPVDFRKD